MAGELPQAKGGVDQVKAGLDYALAAGGSLDQLAGGLAAVKSNFCATHRPRLPATARSDQLLSGGQDSRSNLGAASGGLGAGVGRPRRRDRRPRHQLVPGAVQIRDGLATRSRRRGSEAGDQVKGGCSRSTTAWTGSGRGLREVRVSSWSTGRRRGQRGWDRGWPPAARRARRGRRVRRPRRSDDVSRRPGPTRRRRRRSSRPAPASRGRLAQLADGAGELADGLGDAATARAGSPTVSAQAADGVLRSSSTARSGSPTRAPRSWSRPARTPRRTSASSTPRWWPARSGRRPRTWPTARRPRRPGLTAYSFVIQGDDGESRATGRAASAGSALLGAGGGVFALRRRLV